MASTDAKVVPFVRQPAPPLSLAAQMDRILMVLNATENLSVLTEGILHAVAEGEPYEVLVRKIQALHGNIVSIAEYAAQAKFVALRN
jgi:hypothetical protein